MGEKVCRGCGNTYPLSAFYKNKNCPDGYGPECKDCVKAAVSARYWQDPEKSRTLSRQRNHKYHRTEKGRKTVADKRKQFRREYPDRTRAHNAVSNAIRAGRLERQPCEVCGKKAQAHHDDYSKPLDVRWLCPLHHTAVHAELRASG